MGYDPLTTLRGFSAVSEMQNAALSRRERLLRLAQDQKQVDQQNQIDAAAKASVTNVPGQTDNLGTFRAGGADLPMGSVSMAPHAEFDRAGFINKLTQIDPLQAQGYEQTQASIQQKQQDATLERATKLAGLEKTLGDVVAQKGAAAAKTDLENVNAAAEWGARRAMAVQNAPVEMKDQILQSVYAEAMQHPGFASHVQELQQRFPHYTKEMDPFLDSIITGATDVKTAVANAQKGIEDSAKTVNTAEGVMQYNPKTQKYDNRIGSPTKALGLNATPYPGGSGGFSDAALDQAAELYATSGQMPSLGMGKASSALRVKIANRAAELHPLNNLAENKAGYGADQASLKVVQKSLDSVTAFENTASKNLDQFLATAAKVPDTGVPWLNQPIRSVNASGLGSADQAAFNAARQVALTEISKVVNNPNLTGTLSDSARNEVMSLNPESATFAQIKRVAQVLKTDMANRRTALTSQRDEIKGRIGGGTPSTTPYPGKQPTAQGGGFNWDAHPVVK